MWNEGKKTFPDPVLSGYQVVRVDVEVGGNCTEVPADNPSPQVTLRLNGREIGKYTLTKAASCESRRCNKYVASSTTYVNGFPDYQYGQNNTFQVDVPANTKHCVAYADLKLNVEQRQISTSPNSVDFGRRKVGIFSTEIPVTVSAGPKASVTIKDLVLPSGTQFSVRTDTGAVPPLTAPITIEAGKSMQLFVKFKPSTVSTVQVREQLTIKSNAYTPDKTVELSGYGVQYTNDVITESGTNELVFGEQQLGYASAPKKVTVRNAGTATLTVNDYPIVGPFELLSPPSKGFTLAPGQSVQLDVVFKPMPPGTTVPASSLTIQTGATDQPNAVITLKGTIVAPFLLASPTDWDFGQQVVGATPTSSNSLTVNLKNTGSGTLTVHYDTSISGEPAFAISPAGPKSLVNDGSSQPIIVTFTPKTLADRGLKDTYLYFRNQYGTTIGQVRLKGQGVSKLEMDTVGTHDFGAVPTGSSSVKKTIKLTNRSSIPVQLSSVSVNPPFTVSALSKTLLDTKDSFATFDVQFSPGATHTGSFEESLSVVSDADVNPGVGVLKFRGSGLYAHGVFTLAATPTEPITELAFGGVRETESKMLVVRLHNKGNAALNITNPPSLSAPVYTYGSSAANGALSISPGAYHEFRVTFKPEARADYPGKLTFASSNADAPLVLDLSGKGSFSELRVLPTLVDFGDVQVGKESETLVEISNLGDAPVRLLNLSVTTPFAIVYLLKEGSETEQDKPQRDIASDKPFRFKVVFRPGAESVDPAVEHGTVTISTDYGANKTIDLYGSGTVPELRVDEPFNLDFGNQRLKMPSIAQTLTIRNAGRAELKIDRIGTTKSVFAVASASGKGFPMVIQPGKQEFLDVIFTPATEGEETGQVFFVSDTAKVVNNIPTLKGVGVDGKLKVTPNVVNFGTVDVNSPSASLKSVTLENIGKYELRIKGLTPPGGGFGVTGLDVSETKPLVLAANGGSWTFTTSFAPTTQGYKTASTIIKTDAVTNPDLNLAMDGTGVSAAVELQPPDFITFGKANVGTEIPATLTIKNPGQRTLTVSSIGLIDVTTGTEMAGDFSHAVTAAFDVAANGGSVTVPLKFKPSQVGMREAWAVIRSSASNAPEARVKLVGEGTSPQLKLEPSTLEFGKLLVGNSLTKSFRIKNTGNGPFKLNGITLGGLNKDRFTMTEIGLPLTLNPGGPTGTSPSSFVDVAVTFQPDAVKDFIGTVVVTSDADVKSATVVLTGSGLNDEIEVTNSLFFGQHLVGNRSSPKSVVITNNSAGAIVLSDLSVDESQFLITKPGLSLTIPAKTSREIPVDFTPLVEGEVKGRMRVTFSTPAQQREVELQGKGISKVLSINSLAEKQDFGALRVGTNKTGTPVVLTNLSSEIITLAEPQEEYRLGEAFTYDKSLVANKQLKPGESVSMPVSYAPKEEVPSEVKLLFGTTTPLQSGTVSAVLSGRATKSLIQVDKSLVDFDWVDVGETVSSAEITVVNKSAHQQRVTLAMKNGAPYSLEKSALDNPLPPEGSATFKVIFTPDSPDAFEDDVLVSIQTGEPETTIKVRGNGRDIMAGGGGCACGSTEAGSAGMLMLLALVGLGSRRRRRE